MAISTGMLILSRYVWRMGDHHFYICRHYRVTTVIGAVSQNTVAAYAGNRDMAAISSVLAGNLVAVGCYTHTIRPVGFSETGSVTYNTPIVPYAATPLPPQVSLLVRLSILVPSSRGHGRIHLPSVPETANVLHGVPSAAYRTAVVAALTPLTQQLNVGVPGNIAVLLPVVWRRPGNVATRVTGLSVAKEWSTQRRRGRSETPTGTAFRSID